MDSSLTQMSSWSEKTEEDLALLLKDWLKQQGKTQADLRRSLQAVSTRMPALIEVLKQEYLKGGMPMVANRLCAIEQEWSINQSTNQISKDNKDPFGQLDLILQEIRDDYEINDLKDQPK